MSYKRKPVYQFKDTTETGIDKIPLNRLVYVESLNKNFVKNNNTSLTGISTISDAIDNDNIITLDVELTEMSDVTLDTITNGQTLIYNSVSGYWENSNIVNSEYDSSFLYDASNMNEINCEVNTVISATPSLDSTVKDTTDRQDSSWTSTTTEIYLDNRYVNAEVGETVTTDQGDLVIKEIHDDGGYDYKNEFGYNGYGSFNSEAEIQQVGVGLLNTGGGLLYRDGDKIYGKMNGQGILNDTHISLGYELLLEDCSIFSAGASDIVDLITTENDVPSFYVKKSTGRMYAIGNCAQSSFLSGGPQERDWIDTGIDDVIKVGGTQADKDVSTAYLKSNGDCEISLDYNAGTLYSRNLTGVTDFHILRDRLYIAVIQSGDLYCYQHDNGSSDTLLTHFIANNVLRLPIGTCDAPFSYYIGTDNNAYQYSIDGSGSPSLVTLPKPIKKIIQNFGDLNGSQEDFILFLSTDGTVYDIDGYIKSSQIIEDMYHRPSKDQKDNGSAPRQNPTAGIIFKIGGKFYQASSVITNDATNSAASGFGNPVNSLTGLVLMDDVNIQTSTEYKTKYWVVPETPLASAPSTAYLNTHRAKSPYSYQDEFQNSFGAFKNTKVTISKVDFIDTGKTSTLTKIFFDSSTEVRVQEEFCSQTGETFVLQDIQTDGTGYWGTPSSVLNTAPTAVYGLASIKFNNTLAAQGTAIIGTDIEQNFETTTAASRKFRLNIHQTDTVQVSEIKGDVYRIA